MSRDFEPGMDASPFEADHPPTRYVNEQVYHRAANSDLPDESFVMVSRAMRGKDPLTGDEPQPRPVRYFVAPDASDEETLWRGEPDDPKPEAVAVRYAYTDEHWGLLLRGAGLDGEVAR